MAKVHRRPPSARGYLAREVGSGLGLAARRIMPSVPRLVEQCSAPPSRRLRADAGRGGCAGQTPSRAVHVTRSINFARSSPPSPGAAASGSMQMLTSDCASLSRSCRRTSPPSTQPAVSARGPWSRFIAPHQIRHGLGSLIANRKLFRRRIDRRSSAASDPAETCRERRRRHAWSPSLTLNACRVRIHVPIRG